MFVIVSCESSDLNECDGGVDFSFKALRDPETKVETEIAAVDGLSGGEE